MKIRNPTEDEHEDVQKFVESCEPLVPHPPHFYKIMHEYFGSSFFIAREDGDIVGVVFGFPSQEDNDIFFLWQIGVAKKYRGNGLSPKLMEKVKGHAKGQGCKKIHATVDITNIPSQKLFEKLGFMNASEGDIVIKDGKKAIKEYYSKEGKPQILYEKEI